MPLSPVDHARKRLSEAVRLLEGFPDLVRTLEEIRDRLSRTLLVAVVGEYNSGKSTLLNAILGRQILPTGALPTTACVNYIRLGDAPSVTVYYKDGTYENIRPERFEELTSHDHKDPAQAVRLRLIHHIDVFDKADMLKHVVFADTPGLNAPTEADREVTETVLEESDAILWLTSARQVLSGTEVEVLKKYGKRYKGKSICIISQTDTVGDDDDVAILKRHAGEALGGYFLDIVPLSARRALNGRPEELTPFFNSFWYHIVPRAHEFIADSSVLDACEAIDKEIQLLQSEKERLAEARSDVDEAKAKAREDFRKLAAGIDRTVEDLRRDLQRIRYEIFDYLQTEFDTWTDREPYTKKEEGLFVDDYVVAYRDVRRWTFPEWTVIPLTARVGSGFRNAVAKAKEYCVSHLVETGDRIASLNRHASSRHRVLPGRVPSMDLSVRTERARQQVESLFDSVSEYFEGGMDHGGISRVRDHIHFLGSTERPSREVVTELVDRFLPLDRIHGRLGDLSTLHEAVKGSLCHGHDALLTEIDERIAVRTGSISRLNSAKEVLAADPE
jgi:hypothetical protein